MKTQIKKQIGLSLVEVLVALVISLFLLGGIIQVYLGNKAAYRFSDATSRIQENGRFALDTITTDVRLAGFWGCVNFQGDDNNDGFFADNNPHIQNHLNTTSGNYNAGRHNFIENPAVTATVNDGLNGSDSLTMRGAKPGQHPFLVTLSDPGTGAIQVPVNGVFQTNDIILITNCYAADIFEATAVTPNGSTITHTTAAPANTPGNTNLIPCAVAGAHCLVGVDNDPDSDNEVPYTASNAAAFSLQAVTYSIQASGSGSGEPSLWRSVNNNNQELIEGVEQMQVLFGVDTDGDGTANQYQESNLVVNPSQVTSVRIWLVVRSENGGILDASQTYTINSVDESQGDTRLRHVFSTTIALRNKV